MALFRDNVFAGFVTDSDQNKSLIVSGLAPFLLMTRGCSAALNGISFGWFLLTYHYI